MKLLVSLLVISIAACAPIQHTTRIEQPIGQAAIAGVGDVVMRVDRQRDLENAFGKASISGRKTNEGYSELRFAGVESNGEVVFYRKDVQIMTNETTMSRSRNPFRTTTGTANTNVSGNFNDTGASGTFNANARTTYSSTTMSPTSYYHVIVPADTIPIRLSASETRLPMEGYVIEIIKATSVSLEYRITKYPVTKDNNTQ